MAFDADYGARQNQARQLRVIQEGVLPDHRQEISFLICRRKVQRRFAPLIRQERAGSVSVVLPGEIGDGGGIRHDGHEAHFVLRGKGFHRGARVSVEHQTAAGAGEGGFTDLLHRIGNGNPDHLRAAAEGIVPDAGHRTARAVRGRNDHAAFITCIQDECAGVILTDRKNEILILIKGDKDDFMLERVLLGIRTGVATDDQV